MVLSTSQLRVEYGPACQVKYIANAVIAWEQVDRIMEKWNYKPRKGVTGSRNCRPITGGTAYSLHAFYLDAVLYFWTGFSIALAVAVDINWDKNPYGKYLITDMPRGMVDEICALRTNDGQQIFRWGGYYTGNKDAMHFEIVCSRASLATGVAGVTDTVPPASTPPEEDDMPKRLMACKADRNEWPEIKDHIFITDDTPDGTYWAPTEGFIRRQIEEGRIDGATIASDGTLHYSIDRESPNYLNELLSDHELSRLGLKRPTKTTHPSLSSAGYIG